MAKSLKTAPELERMILLEMRRHAICAGVAAVTVRESRARPGTNWEVAHINSPGGAVPPSCRTICMDTAESLQRAYELLPDFAFDMDF
jgi:hypothetical protein